MIRVLVSGAMGRMGRTVCDAVMAEDDLELAAAIDTAFASEVARSAFGIEGIPLYDSIDSCLAEVKAEVAVDFTIPDSVLANVLACLKQGVHCVVGTTGLGEAQLVEIEAQCHASAANCLMAPNFAIGAVLMMDISQLVARYMPYVEIVELHHDQKLDAPSGTSLRTAEMIAAARVESPEPTGPEGEAARGLVHKGIPIHSVRLPGLVAHQEVVFGGQGQTLSIRHDSISRESFMPGVVLAVRRVSELDGLAVGLEKIM
jgi:4-hydroxy-tetrahydrodipicolinate reductase